MEEIRCPACRGSKKVAKLGGMIGDCNTCKGKGQIKACDKPIMVMAPIPEPIADVIKGVSECVPASSPEPTTQELPLPVSKMFPPAKPGVTESKPKNIYKRKGV